MAKKRNARSASFKAKIAMESLRDRKTISEIAKQYSVHPTQIHQWRKHLVDHAEDVFEDGRSRRVKADADASADELYEQIGRLKMELEWLKKNLPSSADHLRQFIEKSRGELSIRRQCELLGLSRSTYYLEPSTESPENLALIRIIDEQYLKRPTFGSRMMTAWLRRQGHEVNRKRVQRLMQPMNLEAIYPKKNTSKPGEGHKIYPYLLRDKTITRPNEAWCTDITYVPMECGFMYLVAVMDWYSLRPRDHISDVSFLGPVDLLEFWRQLQNPKLLTTVTKDFEARSHAHL